MLTTCRRRARRFPGGGQYRVEIPRSRARRRLRRWSRRPRNTAFPCTASAPVCLRTSRAAGLEWATGDLASLKNGPEVGICSAYTACEALAPGCGQFGRGTARVICGGVIRGSDRLLWRAGRLTGWWLRRLAVVLGGQPDLGGARVSARVASRGSRSASATSSRARRLAQNSSSFRSPRRAASRRLMKPCSLAWAYAPPWLVTVVGVAGAGGGPARAAKSTRGAPAVGRDARGSGIPVIRGRCAGCAVRWRGSAPAALGALGGRGRPGTAGATRAGARLRGDLGVRADTVADRSSGPPASTARSASRRSALTSGLPSTAAGESM